MCFAGYPFDFVCKCHKQAYPRMFHKWPYPGVSYAGVRAWGMLAPHDSARPGGCQKLSLSCPWKCGCVGFENPRRFTPRRYATAARKCCNRRRRHHRRRRRRRRRQERDQVRSDVIPSDVYAIVIGSARGEIRSDRVRDILSAGSHPPPRVRHRRQERVQIGCDFV